ncbi:hypothetical protein BGZ51_009311 [Haplosporangium sp. Z 767]|nr:hypothetical protein BGZ50_003475 [Haplosporangium sp. Z 11]KAF9189768.1 hypothetical protein BGZ51_009311 [Haplosporangium sp. Z 767]
MGNLPSSISTEPLAQGNHRNLSTISLPPTIPRRHNMKDAERREIFPISDEGAPPLPNRRGSIGFFRGKRNRAPVTLDHHQLFQNLQNLQDLQNLDMANCSWQTYQLQLSDSNPHSNLNSLSTTPTTAATTPGLTAAATPTTPIGAHHHLCQLHPHQQSRSPQPTSPVAASIQDHHSQQEQKLAMFMKRNLLPPHALLTPSVSPHSSSFNSTSSSNSTSPSPTIDCCSNAVSPTLSPCAQMPSEHSQQQQQQQQHGLLGPSSHHSHYHRHNNNKHNSSCDHRPGLETHPSVDSIPSTHDVPTLSVTEWGNRGRWSGEQEWSDDIPEGLEHDGGPWDTMDSYTVEQHISRALFKGQNYSAPLNFTKEAGHSGPIEPIAEEGSECGEDLEPTSKDIDSPMPLSSSYSSMATSGSQPSVLSKENERSLVILSVGCGNTQWATEMALAHPQSAVHAINVSQLPSLPPVPETTPSFDLENLFFYNLDDNSLRVPFVSNSVDFIHVRRFLPNVNKTKYMAFLRELVRVLKVDGYLELVELDLRLRGSGVDSCWPSYWTLIGFDKMGIDTSLALNLGGIMRTMPEMEVIHKSSVNMPVGIHGGRIGLAAELLCWRFALTVRPWLMRQAMLSGAEFDELIERAQRETRTLKSYQVCHVAVGRKTADGAALDTVGDSSVAPPSSALAGLAID